MTMPTIFHPENAVQTDDRDQRNQRNQRQRRPRLQRMATGRALGVVAVYLALMAGSLVLLFPLWWMVVVSLSTPGEAQAATATAGTFRVWPETPQWRNYAESLSYLGSGAEFTREQMQRWFDEPAFRAETGLRPWYGFFDALANSVVVTALNVVGTVLSCSLVGYAFARLRFRGSRPAFVLMLSTMMLPAQVTMIPLFLLFRSLGWIDTLLPLIVPSFFGIAFFIFMFRQFFSQVPEELLDAARIDGANHLGIWWRIMLPMCRPVIAITAIFTFIAQWNDFLHPLIYLHSRDMMTLSVALQAFKDQWGAVSKVHLLMAASVVTMLPCVILFFVAQQHFVKGLNLGAVKG
ncbi:MAG: carbohydrate ABC transporter permease [Planctomycetota bacterium]